MTTPTSPVPSPETQDGGKSEKKPLEITVSCIPNKDPISLVPEVTIDVKGEALNAWDVATMLAIAHQTVLGETLIKASVNQAVEQLLGDLHAVGPGAKEQSDGVSGSDGEVSGVSGISNVSGDADSGDKAGDTEPFTEPTDESSQS